MKQAIAIGLSEARKAADFGLWYGLGSISYCLILTLLLS